MIKHQCPICGDFDIGIIKAMCASIGHYIDSGPKLLCNTCGYISDPGTVIFPLTLKWLPKESASQQESANES